MSDVLNLEGVGERNSDGGIWASLQDGPDHRGDHFEAMRCACR